MTVHLYRPGRRPGTLDTDPIDCTVCGSVDNPEHLELPDQHVWVGHLVVGDVVDRLVYRTVTRGEYDHYLPTFKCEPVQTIEDHPNVVDGYLIRWGEATHPTGYGARDTFIARGLTGPSTHEGQCRHCGRRREVASISRSGGGTYRRGGRSYSSSICIECAVSIVEFGGTHAMASSGGFDVSRCAEIARLDGRGRALAASYSLIVEGRRAERKARQAASR
jgi:hypothetical protein